MHISLLLLTALCTPHSHPQRPLTVSTTPEGFFTWESPIPVRARLRYRRSRESPVGCVYGCRREYRSELSFPLPRGEYTGWIEGFDRRGRVMTSDSLQFSGGSYWNDDEILEMTTIDVGWGDSHLLILPGGKAVLVDCGSIGHLDNLLQYLDTRLSVSAQSRIDVLVLTHSHRDHIGGAIGNPDHDGDGILERFSPSLLILPDTGPDSAFTRIISCAESRDIDVHHLKSGDDDVSEKEALGWDPLIRVEVLNSGWPDDPQQTNNTSLVLKITYGDVDILLTGDAEQPAEHRMLGASVGSGRLACEVLKVGHHGCADASSPSFLRAVGPRVSLLSIDSREVGWSLPDEGVLAMLESLGSDVFRTDGLHPGGSGVGSHITILSDGRFFDVMPR